MRQTTVSILLSMCLAAVASAQGESKEPALAVAAKDGGLKWGPCPEFMPPGCQIAVLHGDPAKHNADIFLKIPAGRDVARHWHTSAERMVLISGELKVAYDGQAPETLRPGMYAYGPAKAPHNASCAPGDACVLFIAFESPVDAVKSDETAR